MPVETTYTCEVCGRDVGNGVLAQDAALRRLIVGGGAITRYAGGLEERQFPQLVFCSYDHAGRWLASQSF